MITGGGVNIFTNYQKKKKKQMCMMSKSLGKYFVLMLLSVNRYIVVFINELRKK